MSPQVWEVEGGEQVLKRPRAQGISSNLCPGGWGERVEERKGRRKRRDNQEASSPRTEPGNSIEGFFLRQLPRPPSLQPQRQS